MAKLKEAHFGPFVGYETTLTAARHSASNKALDALNKPYLSVVLCLGDEIGIVHSTATGVASRIVSAKDGIAQLSNSESWSNSDIKVAAGHLANHMAQRAYDPETHNVEHCERVFYGQGSTDPVFPDQLAEFRHWSNWQARYRQLRASGLTDEQAHQQV